MSSGDPRRGEGPRELALLVVAITTGLTIVTNAWAPLHVRVGVYLLVTLCITLGVTLAYRVVEPWIRLRFTPGAVGSAVMHAGLVFSGTVVGAEVALQLLGGLLGVEPSDYRPSVLRLGLVIATGVSVGSVITSRLRDRLQGVELERERARTAAVKAELRAIQARIEPHFLFNSLNVVSSLIATDPERAEEVLDELSDLFRYVVVAFEHDRVPLAHEVEAVRRYLDIQQMRLGPRLRFSIDIEEAAHHVLIAPHILLPLVENAVKHGVAPREGIGEVRIGGEVRGDTLLLSVEDSGPGPHHSSYTGTQTALTDLAERLALHGAGEVRLEDRARGGTLATVVWRTS